MAEDSGDKITLLPRFPTFNAADPEINDELQKIYDTVNILADRASTLIGGENYSQEERAVFWAEGNTVNCKLGLMALMLVKYTNDCYPGDLIRFTINTMNTEVNCSNTIGGEVLGMCIDNVAAGQVAYVYIKGVVPFTKFALVPGRVYCANDNPADGPLNSLIQARVSDSAGTSDDLHLVGIAISSNSIMLQCNQKG